MHILNLSILKCGTISLHHFPQISKISTKYMNCLKLEKQKHCAPPPIGKLKLLKWALKHVVLILAIYFYTAKLLYCKVFFICVKNTHSLGHEM